MHDLGNYSTQQNFTKDLITIWFWGIGSIVDQTPFTFTDVFAFCYEIFCLKRVSIPRKDRQLCVQCYKQFCALKHPFPTCGSSFESEIILFKKGFNSQEV